MPLSAFDSVFPKIPLGGKRCKIILRGSPGFNPVALLPVIMEEAAESGRCAPCDPRAHRSGPDYRGSPWYTPAPEEQRYNPAYRPDSPCWDGKYDNGTYSCHDCECRHSDGICCRPLMAPTPIYPEMPQYVPTSPQYGFRTPEEEPAQLPPSMEWTPPADSSDDDEPAPAKRTRYNTPVMFDTVAVEQRIAESFATALERGQVIYIE